MRPAPAGTFFTVNLLRWLNDYANAVRRFTQDPAEPFVNNLGEWIMRRFKVKEKVSKWFSSAEEPGNFCTGRSCLVNLQNSFSCHAPRLTLAGRNAQAHTRVRSSAPCRRAIARISQRRL